MSANLKTNNVNNTKKSSAGGKINAYQICLVALAVGINIAGGQIALLLKLPVYLDSIGTILTGALLGPWFGMLPNLISGIFMGMTVDIYSLYFAPVVISMTCCSMVWLWIYNDLYGVLNYLLQTLGIIQDPILWMNSAKTSLPAVIFMVTWKMSGFSMLIILAAFQSVDEQIYEAASVDGANKVKQFFRITLPIIKPHAALALILSVIGSVLAFEQFLIMTKGGPAQDTTTIVHYIYNTSFKYFKMGYGSAMTMILLLVLGVLSYFENKVLQDPTK